MQGARPQGPQGAAMTQMQRAQMHASEGSAGQMWIVRKSPQFQDVIVRDSQEVTSKELRRILPNETCIQRGDTITLPNGLVRMPVRPAGWVTVHARHINGPTFLEEVKDVTGGLIARDRPPPYQDSRRLEAMHRGQPEDDAETDLIERLQSMRERGERREQQSRPWVKEMLLAMRERLMVSNSLTKASVPEIANLRLLHVPAMGEAPRERKRDQKEHRDKDKDRDRDRDRDHARESKRDKDKGVEGSASSAAKAPADEPAAPARGPLAFLRSTLAPLTEATKSAGSKEQVAAKAAASKPPAAAAKGPEKPPGEQQGNCPTQ